MSDELLRSDDETPGTSDEDAGTTMTVTAAAERGSIATVTVREDVLTSAAAVAGFVAGAGGVAAAVGLPLQVVGLKRRTPFPRGIRMNRRNAQLAPAMYSLAATNAQLLGLVGSRRPLLSAMKAGVALAAVAYLTADEEGRNKMINQATALVEQGGALVAESGVLDVLFKR